MKQDDAPIFDTQALQLNAYNNFNHERYVGGDRVSDVNFLTYGFEIRRWREAREEFFVGLSQRYYFDRPRVVLDDEIAPTKGLSNVLLSWNILPDAMWRINGEVDWHPNGNDFRRFHIDAKAVFSGGRYLRAGVLIQEEESVLLERRLLWVNIYRAVFLVAIFWIMTVFPRRRRPSDCAMIVIVG